MACRRNKRERHQSGSADCCSVALRCRRGKGGRGQARGFARKALPTTDKRTLTWLEVGKGDIETR